MLRILGRANSANVQKVVWLLREMNQPFEREDYGGAFGKTQTDDYLRLNPNGTVPTLVDGDAVLWESNTIMRYLGTPDFYPIEPAARARCERWMDWQLGTLNLCMTPLFIQLIRTPAEERNPGDIERHRQRAQSLFGLLDRALATTRFLAGDGLTLGDISTGVVAYRWFRLDIHRGGPTPHLDRWYADLVARPSYRATVMKGLS